MNTLLRLGQVSDNELRLLRIFMAVVRNGGLSAAELELNIGRSTISRYLKDLEIRLGATLCHRGRSGFRLTEAGERVHAAARQLFAAIDSFHMDVSELHGELRGRLRLAFFDKTVTNPEARLSDAIARFTDYAPRVTLEVHVEPTNLIESGVIDGTFHLGIIPAHRDSPSLHYQDLFREQMYLYCGAGHPLFARPDVGVTDADVRAARFVGMGFHSPNMRTARELGLARGAEAFDQEAVATLILSGRYVGFLPDHYAAGFVQDGRMRSLRPQRYRYVCEFAAIVRQSPPPPLIVHRFMECLAEGRR